MSMTTARRRIIVTAALAMLAVLGTAATAQRAYPNKTI